MTVLRRLAFPLRLVGARLGAGGERLALVAVGVVAGAAVLAAVLGGRLVMQDRALVQAAARLAPATVRCRSLERRRRTASARSTRSSRRACSGDRASARRARCSSARRRSRAASSTCAQPTTSAAGSTSSRAGCRRAASRRTARCSGSKGAGPIPSTPYLRLIEVGRATLDAGRAVRAVRAAGAADRDGRARRALPHAAAVADRDRERRRGALAHDRARDVLPLVRAGSSRSAAASPPVVGRRVPPRGAAADGADRRELGRLPGDRADRPARRRGGLVDAPRRAGCCCSAARAAALLLAFTILAAAAMRRDVDGRAAAARLVRRAALAGRAVHARRVGALAALGTVAGWVAGGARRGGRRRRGGLARRRRSSRTPALARRHRGRARRRRGRRPAPLRDRARAGRAARPARVHAARRRRARRGRDRARRWARGSVDAQQLARRRHERVPPARAGADRLRRRRRRRAAARAGAARARPRRPARARSRCASRPRRSRATPGTPRSPRRSSSRASGSRSSRSRTARRSSAASRTRRLRGARVVRARRGLVAARAGAARRAARPLPGDADAGAAADRQRPVAARRSRSSALPARRLADVGGWRTDFASQPLPQLGAAIAPPRDASPAHDRAARRAAVHAAGSASGDDIGVRAIFRSPLGDYLAVSLGHTHGARTVVLHGRMPFVHATLAQLQLDILNSGRITANAGTGIQPSAKGVLTFGAPRVDGTTRAARVRALDRHRRRERRPRRRSATS